ncbi:MAG: AAA family ATPase [Lachnospiraceae bacterium]|nr:AAA family ATPase [Lachnospiraceae bacterium]
MYLESFTLPVKREEELIIKRMAKNAGLAPSYTWPEVVKYGYIDNEYPCGIFAPKGLDEIRFRKVTIFYGGNGSGKSTILNLIAAKLDLKRIAPFNSSELFDDYAEACQYTLGYDDEGSQYRIPDGSRIITSDDIFDYMLAVRANNEDIKEETEQGKAEYARLKYGDTVKFNGLEDYDELRLQLLARQRTMTRRRFLRQTAGTQVKLSSNGETALAYFEQKLQNDTLYCLDEPENSMSPRMQMELMKMLEEMERYCGCQFIIATHSPFLLSMEGARIYDLDASPAEIRNWWELENVKIYYDLFAGNRNLFEED